MRGPWSVAVVAVICLAASAGWKALLRTSPIDPLYIDLPDPPPRVGVYAYNTRLQDAIKLGAGLLPGPEDLAVDVQGRLYTGCSDGWIKRISFIKNSEDIKVENWTYVGGHPLGVALGLHGELLVCEPGQGLLNVTEGKFEILSNEAEGLKFKWVYEWMLADGIDVTKEGVIYFTDATYKYELKHYMLDLLEYRPHGRLLKYDPATKTTTVLLKDLYFANGVALSAKQDFLVFCETPIGRCQKYWVQGEKEGSVESFIDNLPGFTDNIRYDREGTFWIAFPRSRGLLLKLIPKYPFLRHVLVFLLRLMPGSNFGTMKEAGVLAVDKDGRPIALYSHPKLTLITSGLKIGNYLYFGSLSQNYIGRLDLTQ
eukprot:Gb_04243 [translate_table: standard]